MLEVKRFNVSPTNGKHVSERSEHGDDQRGSFEVAFTLISRRVALCKIRDRIHGRRLKVSLEGVND